jgi:hypothetical protein
MVGVRVGIWALVAAVVGVGVLLIEIRARVGTIPGVSAEVVPAEVASVVSADVVPVVSVVSADVAPVVSANVASTDMVFAGVVSVAVSGAGDCESSGSGLRDVAGVLEVWGVPQTEPSTRYVSARPKLHDQAINKNRRSRGDLL